MEKSLFKIKYGPIIASGPEKLKSMIKENKKAKY